MELTCPKCQGVMRQYERSGVVVDQCTECRGIFLDRGELERLADAESAWNTSHPAPQPAPPPAARGDYRDDYRGDRGASHGGHYGRPQKRRKSFFDELFD